MDLFSRFYFILLFVTILYKSIHMVFHLFLSKIKNRVAVRVFPGNKYGSQSRYK